MHNNNPRPILISGFIGSGKSTLAKHLAKHFRLKYISASEIHRKLVLKRMKNERISKKAKDVSHGFWETKAGKRGLIIRAENLVIDRTVDQTLLRELKKNPCTVTDARLMPWLYKGKAIRIWLSASEKARSQRVGKRDDIPAHEAKKDIRARMKTDKQIWKNLYGIQMGEDFTPFDVVIDNENMSAEQTFNVVKALLGEKNGQYARD